MTQMKLTKEHIQALKGLAHSMKPVLIMGEKGVTESFLAEAERAIEYHELIKIRISGDDREAKKAIAAEITTTLNANMIQHIGNVITLFKRNHEAPKIFFSNK